jgi:hypothetical protein
LNSHLIISNEQRREADHRIFRGRLADNIVKTVFQKEAFRVPKVLARRVVR